MDGFQDLTPDQIDAIAAAMREMGEVIKDPTGYVVATQADQDGAVDPAGKVRVAFVGGPLDGSARYLERLPQRLLVKTQQAPWAILDPLTEAKWRMGAIPSANITAPVTVVYEAWIDPDAPFADERLKYRLVGRLVRDARGGEVLEAMT